MSSWSRASCLLWTTYLPQDIYVKQKQISTLFDRSTICRCLYYCCSRQYEVCLLTLEVENSPADMIFIASSSPQLLHYSLCSSTVISPFFTWKIPSPSSIIISYEKPSPTHSDSFPLNPLSSPRTSYLIKNPMIKCDFRGDSSRKLEKGEFCLTLSLTLLL